MKSKIFCLFLLFVLLLGCVDALRRRQKSDSGPKSLKQLVKSSHRIVRRYTLGNDAIDQIMYLKTIARLRRTNGCTPQNFHNFFRPSWSWKREQSLPSTDEDALPSDPFEVQKRIDDEDEAEEIIDFISELFAAYKRCKQLFCPDDDSDER